MLIGHTGWVAYLAFSPDGATLASGGDDRTVRLWDVEARQEIATLVLHHGSSANALVLRRVLVQPTGG
jgi:WD40 repeat protein